MTEEKKVNSSYKTQEVSEAELEGVTGGNSPGYQTTNNSTYRSGNRPKYNVGDIVQVKFIPVRFPQNERWISFYVTGVSTDKDGGLIFTEYTYTLKDTVDGSCVLTDVYESCMRSA